MKTRKHKFIVVGKISSTVVMVSVGGYLISPYAGSLVNEMMMIGGAIISGVVANGALRT